MIIPAIIPKSLDYLNEKVSLLSFAGRLQIDLVDGEFVPEISWPYSPDGSVADADDLLRKHAVEIDLMVSDPVAMGREWLASGAKALIFHLESLLDTEEAVVLRKEFDFELGLSISNQTSLEALYPYIEKADFVQLMGIETIGSQGQPFYPQVLDRVATLRHLFPKLLISVDGGVNEDNALSLKQAGTDRLVVGSNILKADDPRAQYEKLLKIISV